MTSRARDSVFLAAAGFGALMALRRLSDSRRAYDLKGKVVLITGGSRGLGLILAREFGRQGAKAVICARNEDELARGEADLHDRGIECLAVPCDITDPEDADQLLERTRDRFGRIDVLINNAGIILVGPLDLMTEQDFDDAMRTHFYGPLHLILKVIPEMKSRREGRIVNIASIGGKIASPHLAAYCASKFALVGLSEGLRAELNKDGIRVTTVCPGIIRTGSHSQAKFKGQNEKEYSIYTMVNAFPLASGNAESAGRKIVRACRYGVADITLPRQYAAAAMVHGMAPGLTADLMSLAARALPGPAGRYEAAIPGKQSKTKLTESILTAHLRKAARAHNEAA